MSRTRSLYRPWSVAALALLAGGLVRGEPPKPVETAAQGDRKPPGEVIRPLPLPPIPDDPPPHEGALIDIPYVIEPPDLLIVEVIEALPGRPISGERLVRPDGTINLGWYGDVHVRGLTHRQAKVKVIEHLKKHLPDEVLGLNKVDPADGEVRAVDPADSNRVFVDTSAYNSQSYYVQGNVASPGRIPTSGKDTVLDALNYSGGLIPVADPKAIRLVRPGRGGKPAKVYPVDLEAITEKGESRLNYQVFPGDRIVVDRSRQVQATVASDRLAALLTTLVNGLKQTATLSRDLGAFNGMSNDQINALRRDLFRVWWDAATKPEGELDESVLRDVLRHHLKPTPADADRNGPK